MPGRPRAIDGKDQSNVNKSSHPPKGGIQSSEALAKTNEENKDGETNQGARKDEEGSVNTSRIESILNNVGAKSNWLLNPTTSASSFTPKIVPRKEKGKGDGNKRPNQQNTSKVRQKGDTMRRGNARGDVQMTASGPFSMGPASKAPSISVMVSNPRGVTRQATEGESQTLDITSDLPKDPSEDFDDFPPDLFIGKDSPLPPQRITARKSEQDSNDILGRQAVNTLRLDSKEPFLLQLPESILLNFSDDSTLLANTPPDTTELSNMMCGEVYIHKSGKVRMRVGDITLDLNSVPRKNYYQTIAQVNKPNKTCKIVAELDDSYLVTPNVASLFKTL